jgi:hypothetical protein
MYYRKWKALSKFHCRNAWSNLCNSYFVADEMYVLSAKNNRVSIQLLGKEKIEDKVSRFEELTGASLSYLAVSSAGSSGQVSKTIPSEFVVCLNSFFFYFLFHYIPARLCLIDVVCFTYLEMLRFFVFSVPRSF